MAGILSMLPLASSAATLPLDGSYGNRDGCAYAKSGEYTGSEDFLLLTADNVRSAVAFCEFKRIEKVDGDRTSVAMSCADEGEAGEKARCETQQPARRSRATPGSTEVVHRFDLVCCGQVGRSD